jgi:hypothetical protein
MFSKRTMFVALTGLVAASAAKTSSFSVCTDKYEVNSGGGTDLYACLSEGKPDLTNKVGTVSFTSGDFSSDNGQNGQSTWGQMFEIEGW